ncbi:MAG: hypothetical protein FWB74_09855 [Defluviitaleaceae bacterium]|nr:hypothetical protein [Defluviitaleaceae bacterium]
MVKKPSGRIFLLVSGIFLLLVGVPFLILSVVLAVLYFWGVGLLDMGVGILGSWLNNLVPEAVTEAAGIIPGLDVPDATGIIGGVVDGATFLIFRWVRTLILLEITVNLLMVISGIAGIAAHKKPEKALRLTIFGGIAILLIVMTYFTGFSVMLITLPRLAVFGLFLAGAIMNFIFMRKQKLEIAE